MGYRIGNNAIKPLESRAEGIVNYPMSTTKKQLQRFIGLIGYDRNFIEALSDRIRPLYRAITKKGKALKWNTESIKSSENIKKMGQGTTITYARSK